ncbi:insulinase family protein [Reinekea blandensis]|uniref:Predicted Zn-dependent peptidase, insulinase-like protein n=1 Tax=Reinekea blandensis MED297 TaxID=314283 RepID=A4BDR9_9GAMM|nr:insulinase family protein [Reinekea blandensis]EAR09678.1 predicted Zn-dependent peptidase, insulinase-like protein [Reinekea blandensis MED297]
MTQIDLRSTQVTPHSAFDLVDCRYVDSLNVRLEYYRHRKTGAEHYHLAADSDENVFMVSLRTMPQDSTGVAHILEHTALCGSEKYPVRDPFFMMTRRSLNTFMNAMTSSDWTAYPFASENTKDYENLLSVYLDAVFFSRLDELDFLQEGHRLEFNQADDASSGLTYKGVVFNEMKGAMSSPVSQLYQAFKSYLFPSNTYHYNSGGDPEHIPDLTYEQLKAFYKTHYHPSNASFFTFGNRPASDIQARMETQALSTFDPLEHRLSVPREKRFSRPLEVTERYPSEGETDGKTYHSIGWLLGESTDLIGQLEAHLLSDLLLDNSASPLRQALENSELGTNPSPLCGLDDSNREMLFMCGLEGSEPEQAEAFEKLVLDTLQSVADQGVEEEHIDAMLHQLELSQREITGDGYPYGLQLIFSVTGAATHGGSVMDALDIDGALDILRQRTREPGYIQSLVKRLLLDNAHRVRLVMRPDNEMKSRQQANEQARLEAIEQTLSDDEKQRILDQAAALKERQEQVDDGDLLPKVTLKDVKPDVKRHSPVKTSPVIAYSAGTNGLAYQQWYWPIPSLTDAERELFPLYTSLLSELGAGELSYLETQQRQAARTGNVNLYSIYKSSLTDTDQLTGYLVFTGKSLDRYFADLTDIMAMHWLDARFDETARVRDYMTLMSSRRLQGVTGSGHGLAMQAASARHSNGSSLIYHGTGLPAIVRLTNWVQQWKEDPTRLEQWLSALQSLHQKMQQQSPHALIIGEQDVLGDMEARLQQSRLTFVEEQTAIDQTLSRLGDDRAVWSTDTNVNFCAAAYSTVPPTHADSPKLTVLAGVLQNNVLHTKIREQGGAYGGGASHDNSNGVFRFYSYRDPRLQETLADFTASLDWVRQGEFSDDQVEQAILGVVSSLDKPGSPAGEVKGAYQNRLFGRTDEFRRQYREGLLSVNKADLIQVANTYFAPDSRTEAIITDSANAEQLAGDGFTWHKLS